VTGRLRITLAAGGAVAGLLLGTIALRAAPFFKIRQVELIGVRYLAPGQVLLDGGLEPDQNLFDDLSAFEQGLRRIPGVVDARVERRFPAALRVVISERIPVAFAPGPEGLIALDANAEPLPYAAEGSDLDLPILAAPDSGLTGALAMLVSADRDLYDHVQMADWAPDGAVRFDLGGQVVLLDRAPTAEDVIKVAAVRRHLAASGIHHGELDGRYSGIVVIRGLEA
jgi:hypothetical protein